MKNIFCAALLLLCCGCSTVKHFDADGNLIEVEEATNFSRAMDGTNTKSQLILVEGLFARNDVSMTAGESYTPGWTLTLASGKLAVMNLKDEAKLNNCDKIVKNFFQKIEATKDGIKTE